MKILIIVPAFNEEDSLKHTLVELQACLDDLNAERDHVFDYIIVNDGSFDKTPFICRENGYPFLDLPINTGLSSAFQAGMKYAERRGYDFALQFDADGQHDSHCIAQMIDAAISEDADIVIGSRFVGKKKHVSLRMVGSAFIIGMIRVTTGQKVTDPTSGLRLFDRRLIERFARDNNYAPEPDTIAFALRNGAKVVEVPVVMKERFAGKSYLTAAKSITYMLRMGLSILFFQWVRKA